MRWKNKKSRKERKEQLDLEMKIAASMAKVNVLKASEGSRVSRAETDGINSYFEKGQRKSLRLNADADTFVPAALGRSSQCILEDVQLRSH